MTQYAHIFRPSHRSGGRKHTFYHRLVGFTFLRCYWTAKGKLLRRPPSMLSLLRGQAKKKVATPMAQECESTLEGPIPRHQGTSPWHSVTTCLVEATGARTIRGSPQERERMLSTELILRLIQHIKYWRLTTSVWPGAVQEWELKRFCLGRFFKMISKCVHHPAKCRPSPHNYPTTTRL